MVPHCSLRGLLLGLNVFFKGINFLGYVGNLERANNTNKLTDNTQLDAAQSMETALQNLDNNSLFFLPNIYISDKSVNDVSNVKLYWLHLWKKRESPVAPYQTYLGCPVEVVVKECLTSMIYIFINSVGSH